MAEALSNKDKFKKIVLIFNTRSYENSPTRYLSCSEFYIIVVLTQEKNSWILNFGLNQNI
jgi:hypothetical protein